MRRDKRLVLSLHPRLMDWLGMLHQQGLHGLTVEETALRLIEEGIRERVRGDWLNLDKRPKGKP